MGNAWFARMAVEAILDMSYRVGDRASEPHAAPPPPPRTYTSTPPIDGAGAAVAAAAPSPLSHRPLPYPGSAVAEGGNVGSRGGDVTKEDDDERKGLAAQEGGAGADAAAAAAGRTRATWEATQKETKRADALAAAAADAAARSGAGAGEAGGEEKEKLPAARAGEAYGGGEMRKWMFDWKAKKAKARRGPLNVTVFVSDFHADRMDAVFQWVFGLEPSLLKGKTTVTVRPDGFLGFRGSCGCGVLACPPVWGRTRQRLGLVVFHAKDDRPGDGRTEGTVCRLVECPRIFSTHSWVFCIT